MNQIQTAIAKVTGLSDVVEDFQVERTHVADVMEELLSDNALLQRQIEDLEYLNLFESNQVADVLPIQDRKKTLARLRRLRHDNPVAKQAVKLIVRFTLGQGVQWTLAPDKPQQGAPMPELAPPDQQSHKGIVPIKYIPAANGSGNGTGPKPNPFAAKTVQQSIVDPLEDNDPIRDIINNFWNDSDNKLAFTTHHAMQVMLDEVVTDGEKFYACFESSGEPYLKVTEIPIEEIVDIIYNPDNRLEPIYYKRQYTEKIYDGSVGMYKPSGTPITKYYRDYRVTDDKIKEIGKKITIPKRMLAESKMRHVMINELITKGGKRGISELYASREWFRVFREFMEGRAAINAAAQAISYVRKIKGGPSAVAGFKGKFGGLNVGDVQNDPTSTNEIQKLTQPVKGAIYDSNPAVDLDWMKTDTGAQNAKEDANLLLATAGAGVGTMSHYFGQGGDANLATAQSMELPMVKSYEDWQQFIDDFYRGWFEYVLLLANGDQEQATKDVRRVGFAFPPIIMQDVVKFTTAWAQIVRDIAPNNLSIKREAMRAALAIMKVPNIDGIMPAIEAEMYQAETIRMQEKQAMIDLASNSQGNGAPPGGFTAKNPNDGMDPNLKKLASGKGEKVSNGPKPA